MLQIKRYKNSEGKNTDIVVITRSNEDGRYYAKVELKNGTVIWQSEEMLHWEIPTEQAFAFCRELEEAIVAVATALADDKAKKAAREQEMQEGCYTAYDPNN